MTHTSDTPRVPDLPCPKCGHTEVAMTWCAPGKPYQPVRCYNEGEHFDRTCRRCGYGWRTGDVLAAGEAT